MTGALVRSWLQSVRARLQRHLLIAGSCRACGAKWQSVQPVDTPFNISLTCPSCGSWRVQGSVSWRGFL